MPSIKSIVASQRHFFSTGKTKEYGFRQCALLRLQKAVKEHEKDLSQALYEDLGKSPMEGYMTEIGIALESLSYTIKNLGKWVQPQQVKTSLAAFPGKSGIIKEPYGVVLIMSPWNYPFLLSLQPLIGAIAAGNCCILKPSAYSPAVSAVIKKIIREAFPAKYITVVEGGRKENVSLLEQRFDYIFFTGGVTVGKLVMEKASQHLTPVTLELGGKSPCIVDETANLKLAAKRLVFGKFLNSGQTCIAPDYLLVQDSVKDEFLKYVLYWIRTMYGECPLGNDSCTKMVNEKHYLRVLNLIKGEKVLIGGYGHQKTLQIAPTVLDHITGDSPIMQEEIFGPVLPVLTFQNLKEAEDFILARDKPLALYLFSRKKQIWKRILRNLSFGGGCINDTIMHVSSQSLPFGGVGSSGMGSYHGKTTFDTFSHSKSIFLNKWNFDVPIRYHPYSTLKYLILKCIFK